MLPVMERHPVPITWSASGSINLDLSNKPFTITRMVLVVRPTITTTTATWFNDWADRIISSLSLNAGGKTIFDFRNMRLAYWMSRYKLHHLKNYKRPTTWADSATTLTDQFVYVFHFGVKPRDEQGDDNPFDLTAGIPATGPGNLTLQGQFGAAAIGTNVTVTAGTVDVFLYGMRPESIAEENAVRPLATPIWSQETPTPTATSSVFGTTHNIPAGNYLRSMLVLATNGDNSPRDDSVFSSMRLMNYREGRTIFSVGGQTGIAGDYKAAELLTQLEVGGWPPSDNVSTAMTAHTGTVGVPSILGTADAGLVWLPVYKWMRPAQADPYGANLNNLNTGDLRLEYGVLDATGISVDVGYEKYVKA